MTSPGGIAGMEPSLHCWQSKRILSDSDDVKRGQAMNASAKQEKHVRGADGRKVADVGNQDRLCETTRKKREEKAETELTEEDEDEDEDGVHGGRMKPLASFDVNRPSQRRRFQFRQSLTGVDNLPNKAAGVKGARRPRDMVNSSSAARVTILSKCKENSGGLVPLCPGKTHIRGMKPKISSPKASSHSGIPRTFGKKRSRLKTGDSGIRHDVEMASGSSDNWQRGGMDLLLMVLDSGLVEAEGQQQRQQSSEPSSRLEAIKPSSNGTRSPSSTEVVRKLRKLPKMEPNISKSAQEISEDKLKGIEPHDEENDGSEYTADDAIISSRLNTLRSQNTLSSPKRLHSDEDSDTQSDSYSPPAWPRNSKLALSPTTRDSEDDEDEIRAEEAERRSNFVHEVTVKPGVDLGPPLHTAGDVRKSDFSGDRRHESPVSDSAEKCYSSFREVSGNRSSSSKFLIENTRTCQEERNMEHRSKSRSNLRVFHEPSLIIAHDIRPSLIQPVKMVGRLNQCMISNSSKGMGTSPMEVDLRVSVLMEESQARGHTNHNSIPQMCKSKKRKISDHLSAFDAVKMATSVETSGDQKYSAVAITSCGESAFRTFADAAHCQHSGSINIQAQKIQPCGEVLCDTADDSQVRRQAGPQQKMIKPCNSSPNAGHNTDSGLPPTLRPSQCAPQEDRKMVLSSMCGQGRFDSGLQCQRIDEAFDVPPALTDEVTEEVTVAQVEGTVESVPDLVTVVRVADAHRELSSILPHTMPAETHFSRARSSTVEAVAATGFRSGDFLARVCAPPGKRRRRNVPLVASHFQDSHQAKKILPKPWFESGGSLGQCAVQGSATAGPAGGPYEMGAYRKVRRRIGPRKLQAGRSKTKVLPQSLGYFSNFTDSNSYLDNRSEMVRPGAACGNMARCYSHGGTHVKSIRQRRGNHQMAQLESLKSKRNMSIAGKFKRLSEPSGFLGEFNPGIIQRVRNSQQIQAILGALVGVAPSRVDNTVESTTIISKRELGRVSLEDPISCPQAGRDGEANVGPIDVKPHHNGLTSMTEKDILCSGNRHEDPQEVSSIRDIRVEHDLSQYNAHDDNPRETEGLQRDTRTREVKSFHSAVRDEKQPSSTSLSCVETSHDQGKNHLESYEFKTSKLPKHEHSDTQLNESSTVDPNKDRRARTFNQPPVPAPQAAGLVAQWLELLTLDIKGRLSALKRSRRRVRTLLVSERLGNAKAAAVVDQQQLGGEDSRATETRTKVVSDTVECVTWASEQTITEGQIDQWRALFTNMDGVLCMEAAKLESNLWQIQQMVVLCQDPKHFLATGPALPIVPNFSAGKENCPPPRSPFSAETTVVPEVVPTAPILPPATFLTKA